MNFNQQGSYRSFEDVWQEIYVPFDEFVPTSFGRVRKDLPALDPSKIRSFGFLISDKQVGPFSLEVEWIKAIVSPGERSSDLGTEFQADRHSAIRHWIEASISRGAPLYNAGERRLCADLYTLTVKSLLSLAPDELTPQVVERLTAALQEGRRIVAVGTTTTRVLEACAVEGGVEARRGETDLFLLPGSRFRAVDALLTNFHLPRSSLLLLVAAFAGREAVLRAYAEAVRAGYRFYSYGDAMLIR